MKKILTLVAIFLLVSCAQNPKYSNNQSHEWTELTCSGFLTWNDCRQEARTLCPHGFYIANSYENIRIQRREESVACKA